MRLALLLLILAAPAVRAADLLPLEPRAAREAVGAAVLTADAVPFGRLIATRVSPEGRLTCVVLLDEGLGPRTSPLLVEGLLLASDGTLRLPEPAAVLADRMRLTLP
jgi:hypothetical protein